MIEHNTCMLITALYLYYVRILVLNNSVKTSKTTVNSKISAGLLPKSIKEW